MATFCLGDHFSYHRYNEISPEMLEATLADWLEAQESRRPVKWHQLSVVFCHVKESPPAGQSIILHTSESKQLAGLAPEWRPHGYLLFIQYNSNLHEVRIYGGLSLAAYQQTVAEFGYLTLGELQKVPELDGEDDLLAEKRAMQPYYELDDAAEHTLEELVLATNWICTQILGLQQREQTDEAYFDAELTALLRNDTNSALGFVGALFLAACHGRFRGAFVERELRLLAYRLEVCYTTEQQRMYFLSTWFPGLLRIEPNHFARFIGHPDPAYLVRKLRLMDDSTALRQKHAVMQQYMQRRYPQEPQASFYFTGELQYLPEALEWELPSQRGTVFFTYKELPQYLVNYLEVELDRRIGEMKLHRCTDLAAPVWAKVERRGEMKFRSSHIKALLAANPRAERQLVANALWERVELSRASEQLHLFTEDFVLPFIQQLDGNCAGWETEPLLMPKIQQRLDSPSHQRTQEKVSEQPLPDSYEELQSYAEWNWAPCMQRIVQNCRGPNHLQHEARLKMAAMLRRCGYNEAQGRHLWQVLFSETDIYAKTAARGKSFLETEQGQVIVYDYAQNRQENLGVSCASLAGASFCPVSEELRTPDIEECQRGCLQRFNTAHRSNLQYPIRGPENYFHLSIKRV
jgi:hypothetical protein